MTTPQPPASIEKGTEIDEIKLSNVSGGRMVNALLNSLGEVTLEEQLFADIASGGMINYKTLLERCAAIRLQARREALGEALVVVSGVGMMEPCENKETDEGCLECEMTDGWNACLMHVLSRLEEFGKNN